MVSSGRIFPVNALIFIEDPIGAEPSVITKSVFLTYATDSGILVSCDNQRGTEIRLGAVNEVDEGEDPVFEGAIKTPSRILCVRTVDAKTIIEVPVPETLTKLKIWANKPLEASKILIGVF